MQSDFLDVHRPEKIELKPTHIFISAIVHTFDLNMCIFAVSHMFI